MRYLLALLLMTSAAFANDGPCSEQVPPAHYASMSVPNHEVIVLSSQYELRRACGHPWTVLACALKDQPLIYMVNDRFINELAGDVHRGRRWKQCLMVHEIAHLNGWVH